MSKQKDTTLAYFLALAAFVMPVAGLHRFYLNKPVSGLAYLLTWGFFGIGTIIDLIALPGMVAGENQRLLGAATQRGDLHLHLHGNTDPGSVNQLLSAQRQAALPPVPRQSEQQRERQILNVAKANGGMVTVHMVALETDIGLSASKEELERLRTAGFCELDVSEEGAELYKFPGLLSARPLLD